jgi:hypothetical protein
MFTLSESRIIKRSPTEVFNTAADPLTQLKWDPSMLQRVEKLTPEPLGRGSRYRGDFKGMGTVEYEFEEFEPGKRFSHHTIMPMADIRHIFEFEAVSEGTRLTQSMKVEPKGFYKLITPMMKRMMSKRMKVIFTELNDYLSIHPSSSMQTGTIG